MNFRARRTQIRLLLGDMEYWTCSADPQRDQPIRRLALAHAGGDPWQALRRLVDPAWHEQQTERLTATTPDLDADGDAVARAEDLAAGAATATSSNGRPR